VPIVVGINALDENALIKILNEPKNALVKQYKKQFAFDGVDLEFDNDALLAVAKKAIELKTGARGLRAILEDVLLDLMYDVPSDKSIDKIVITKEAIEKTGQPVVHRTPDAEAIHAFDSGEQGVPC